MSQRIVLTESDASRLRALTADLSEYRGVDRATVRQLRDNLEEAEIVPAHLLEPDRVAMQSRVVVRVESSDQESTFTLVYPEEADFRTGLVSVIAPIGAAVVGRREGDVILWQGVSGNLKLRVRKVLSQAPVTVG